MFHAHGVPDDPEVPYREFLAFWVPIDDEKHIQFTLARHLRHWAHMPGYEVRHAERAAREVGDRNGFARAILNGEMEISDIDLDTVKLVYLQDDIAQLGVGSIWERGDERLGHSDVGPILQRRLWLRELNKMANGEPLTQWRYDPEMVPIKLAF
jgi:hypothetical protein